MQSKAVWNGIKGASAAARRQVRIGITTIVVAATAAFAGCSDIIFRSNGTEVEIYNRQLPKPDEGVRDVDVRGGISEVGATGQK